VAACPLLSIIVGHFTPSEGCSGPRQSRTLRRGTDVTTGPWIGTCRKAGVTPHNNPAARILRPRCPFCSGTLMTECLLPR
jgi:hypothetical protein